ncbi:MAG: DUF389 domain-containing protein [Bacteroidales bacterium]|nr:DUF389 domain-containing protein [Bacteroidales bacterium]
MKIKEFLRFIDLRTEVEDFDTIHEEIEKSIVFKGTNLWILGFAIIVASVGLNTNSTAVIIGAMLISPLMGPINGIGYGLATYNFKIFRSAIKNFSFAVMAGLIASTLYFALSPVSTAHSELLARISPTIYDVLIALFGGLAGIVAISSKLKGNVIPGVAIATALMPPLCTAGYGLGTGQFEFFFGAMYLFTINTVFIAISSIVISKVLKFPIRTQVDLKRKRLLNQYIWVVITFTIIPSIYFGYLMVQNEKFSEKASKFTKSISIFEGSYLLKDEINAPNRTIRLVYGGNTLTEKSKNEVISKSKEYDLQNAKLIIDQGFSTDETSNNEADILRNELNALTLSLNKSERTIDSISNKPLMGKQILAEIRSLYAQIKTCSYSETFIFSDTSSSYQKTALIIFSSPKNSLKDNEKNNIDNWLKARLNTTKVKVYFDQTDAK